MKLRDFKNTLLDELRNNDAAVNYLTDAIEDDEPEGFLLAVRDVIEARGGIGQFADRHQTLHRVSLYKALSENGNPLFSTMIDILNTLGVGLRPYLKSSDG